MQNSRRPWFPKRPMRASYGLTVNLATVGVVWLIDAAVGYGEGAGFFIGGTCLLLAVVWFCVTLQFRRRMQLDEELPAAGQDVLTLVRQGRKIEAIKRYRQLHPGIGLREAKRAVDEL